jgi:RNA polymerase sigma-70 factor (ECF subfamily)
VDALSAFAIGVGDVLSLSEMLAVDVRLHSDGGGQSKAPIRVVLGQDRVARFLTGIRPDIPESATVEVREVNGRPAMLVLVGGLVGAAIDVQPDASGQIAALYLIANPKMLRQRNTTLAR